jgi:carbon-monoxide dehydrogenase medium subunit
LDGTLADAGPDGGIVSGIAVPMDPGRVSAYVRSTARSRPDRPFVAVFASAHVDAHGLATDVRVCVGAAAHPPVRFEELERSVSAAGLGPGARRAIAEAYAARIDPAEDQRGSAWYRSELIVTGIERALATLDGAVRGAMRPGRA